MNHAALPLLVVLAGVALGLAGPRNLRGTFFPALVLGAAAVGVQIVLEIAR
jgi:hypothetical protein